MEPGNGDGDEGEMAYTDIYIDQPDVMKDFLKNTAKIDHTTGKHNV